MKKILITGVSGLLGSNLAFTLRDKYAITGQYNRHKPHIEGIDAIQCDLAGEDVTPKVREIRPDVIIHCAAVTDVDYCEAHQEETFKVNAGSAGVLAAAAREAGSKMVFISTDSVYKDTPGVKYKETSELGPLNVYSESKLRGEELVAKECSDHLIVRTTIYGYNYLEKLSLGEWVLCNLEKANPVGMFTDVFFNPILVNDLAKALDSAFQKDLKGIFNIDSRGAASKYDFGVEVAKAFALDASLIEPISVDDLNFKARRPRNMVSDVSRILGYADIPTVEEGVSRFRDLYREKYRERLKKGA